MVGASKSVERGSFFAEFLVDLIEELERLQGVTTEVEEGTIRGEVGDGKNFAPDSGHARFGFSFRKSVGLLSGGVVGF